MVYLITDIVSAKVYKISDKQIKNHQNISYLFILTTKDLSLFILILFWNEMRS